MKKFIKTADRSISWIMDNISAGMTFLIFIIVTVVVIMRFIFQQSSGGIEELPTYFLMIAIWFGAAICARNPKEGLIRIDLVENALKNKPLPRAVVALCASVLSISCIAVYAYLSWEYVVFNFKQHAVTLALGWPMWILTGLTFIACVFLLIYEVVTLIRNVNMLRSTLKGGGGV
jgi:TRAP-type C4-dicarboxylate transport system permease small subunit